MRSRRSAVSSRSARRATCSPKNSNSPLVGVSSRPSVLSRVDLPHPDGPLMATNPPPPRRLAREAALRQGACEGEIHLEGRVLHLRVDPGHPHRDLLVADGDSPRLPGPDAVEVVFVDLGLQLEAGVGDDLAQALAA